MLYDYYKILEIPRTASLDDIKKAYRLKAKLVHPDVNNSPKANEVFAIVVLAYETLIDDSKRYLHDIQLNHVDAEKTAAGKKRHYYGTSVKNDSYSNPANSDFHSDWNSFNNYVYKEKTEEDYYRTSPFLYNMFFVSGITIGLTIIFLMIFGTVKKFWPFPFGFISITGFILVREGFRGLIGKKTVLGNVLKRLRR